MYTSNRSILSSIFSAPLTRPKLALSNQPKSWPVTSQYSLFLANKGLLMFGGWKFGCESCSPFLANKGVLLRTLWLPRRFTDSAIAPKQCGGYYRCGNTLNKRGGVSPPRWIRRIVCRFSYCTETGERVSAQIWAHTFQTILSKRVLIFWTPHKKPHIHPYSRENKKTRLDIYSSGGMCYNQPCRDTLRHRCGKLCPRDGVMLMDNNQLILILALIAFILECIRKNK